MLCQMEGAQVCNVSHQELGYTSSSKVKTLSSNMKRGGLSLSLSLEILIVQLKAFQYSHQCYKAENSTLVQNRFSPTLQLGLNQNWQIQQELLLQGKDLIFIVSELVFFMSMDDQVGSVLLIALFYFQCLSMHNLTEKKTDVPCYLLFPSKFLSFLFLV